MHSLLFCSEWLEQGRRIGLKVYGPHGFSI